MEPVFNFPFEPYDIQKKFMKELYFTIDNREIGIFESPTGTGKSLSICCGALQWLKDNNINTMENLKKEISDLKQSISQKSQADDWLQEEYNKIKLNQTLATLQLKLDRIMKREESFVQMRNRVMKQKTNTNKIDNYFNKAPKKDIAEDDGKDINDVPEETEDDLLIQEHSETDDGSDKDDETVEENESEAINKIYISSRTHSQLSQFVGEIKQTIFNDTTRVVTLASRQHYCINSDVNKLKNINLINERCLDMQKVKSKSTLTDDSGKAVKKTKTASCKACPYYNQTNITKLKERLLVDVMDMEELVKCGKTLKACPYYAARMALDESEVVLISHAGIVSSGARSGMSLKLKDNVLILDEAHGLTAALENAHSAPVASTQLNSVKTYLQFYINKYRARLSNLLKLQAKSTSKDGDDAKIFTVEDFVLKAEIDHLNLRPLVEFCRSSRLAPKLHGFSMRYGQQIIEDASTVDTKKSFKNFLSSISKKKEDKVEEKVQLEAKVNQKTTMSEVSAGSGLYAVLDFLEMLCERSSLGRVLVREVGLKYLLLEPRERFDEVTKQCRSVIVAGGTMEPISEFEALLGMRSKAGEGRVGRVVRCGHVVGREGVVGVALASGPAGVTLNFSYSNRESTQLLDEVGRILRNICGVVPGGVICFVPSYSYEDLLFRHLDNTGALLAIGKKKIVFREPKSAGDVDQVLQKYALAVNKRDGGTNGALLLSVVGGKLSEGLNFSDDLGRCVLVVGMPYPNVKSAELQEKMKYLDRVSPGSASVYYENLCMKAVNQCIGRAVRHANDYAAVVLMDERFSRASTIRALPTFLQDSLITNCSFGQAMGSIAKFFSRHKHKKTS
ncbi:ATP-dependent DNA helicase DDX11 isoform X2 [Leptidea sinapis]|uniref:ATP-dependent DNA helicase DDX11 isoform X2 n=1 Tax=Leptidea sinapis TaxID=189913 RepID=UPI0021C28514|nr:ATP-dependent DNA helicase DDX11 isoform X2 [Leptidea sinapis]